jgi:surface-anchored protein
VPGANAPGARCHQNHGPFDLLGGFGIGLKYHFKEAFTPVDVIAVDGPSSLECGQTGTFTATVNEGATQPVEYRWDFGDGSTGSGLVATHAFSRPGTYTVTFTASNDGSMDSASTTVTCTPPPVPAGVVAFTRTPANRVCLTDDVRFSTSARGDAPVSYSWNFGDGSTGTGANPTHRFTRPGTYTVTLNVSNASGSDSRTMQIMVEDCAPATAVCAVNELNSVFFDVNSSTLTETARQALRENIDALRSPGCEGTRVRIEGFAGPGERNPQQLSEDRARAVMQFYTDNGISGDRLSMMGMGMVGGTTGKKDDTSSLRRVDSIPVR